MLWVQNLNVHGVISQEHRNIYPSLYRSFIHVYCKESRCWELPRDNATEPMRKGAQKGEVGSQEGIMYVLVCSGEHLNLQEGGFCFLAAEHNWLAPVLGKSSCFLCMGPTPHSAEPQVWLLSGRKGIHQYGTKRSPSDLHELLAQP